MTTITCDFIDFSISFDSQSMIRELEKLTITVLDDDQCTISTNIGRQLQKQMNHFDKTSIDYEKPYKFSIVVDSEEFKECFISEVNYNYQTMDSTNSMSLTINIIHNA